MSIFSKFFKNLFTKQHLRLLIVGLDNGGKTTIVNWLKPKKNASVEVVPTVGFQREEFSKGNINFTVFDMSGQSKWRNLWEQHYQDVQAVIFVIDSSDKYRMVVVKDELRALLSSKVLKEKKSPFLFYANKKDLPGALSAAEICKELELDSISDRPWHITQTNALTGAGVEEGINWLAEQLAAS